MPVPGQLSKKMKILGMLATTLAMILLLSNFDRRIERVTKIDTVQALSRIGQKLNSSGNKISFQGLSMKDIAEATAGDIVSLAGMNKATVQILCARAVEEPIEALPIDPPTISVTFGINDSPLLGVKG